MRGATLLRGDATNLPLADGSVDLIVTSPPYFALRSYQDGGEHYDGQIGSEPTPREFLEALWAATREMARVLKPSGSIFANLGDKYAGSGGHNNSGISDKSTLAGNDHRGGGPKIKATKRSAPDSYNKTSDVRAKSLMGLPWLYANGCTGALAALGGPDPGFNLILRAEIVWSKPNGLPESVTDRVRRSHEQWFHFTKEPRYYTAVDEIREPHAEWTLKAYEYERRARERDGGYKRKKNADRVDGGEVCDAVVNPLGRLPGSVWTIPSEPLRVPEGYPDHFAAFPQEWPRRFILGWSPPGICVECDQGRRPVVARKKMEWRESPTIDGRSAPGASRKPMSGTMLAPAETTITGYACACDTPNAPTRPAVVLDPFCGTGTTVMVARALGRHGIGVDMSADYLRLARWRVFASGHASKAVERTNREAQGVLL